MIEAYNKIVKAEFLALENISNIDDGKLRYDMFVRAYNEARERQAVDTRVPQSIRRRPAVGVQSKVVRKQSTCDHNCLILLLGSIMLPPYN